MQDVLVIIRHAQFPAQRRKGSLKPKGLEETSLPAKRLTESASDGTAQGARLSLALLRGFFAPFLQC